MKRFKRVIVFILAVIVFLPSNILANEQPKDVLKKNIHNILLIGKDSAGGGSARSDAMIILTIDSNNNALKLTSLARDTLVYIEDKGYEKLNHAYAYGKEELLIDTINNNFDLDIKDYASVDFLSFIDIVDILNGVEINVKSNEIDHLNKFIKVSYGLRDKDKGNIKYVEKEGLQSLNGYQALAYARIRKIDTIYKRDERQREILTNIANKLSNTSITKYPAIIKVLAKNIDVNISFDKIMKLAFLAHELGSYDIAQMEFPIPSSREEGRLNKDGMYVVKWNIEENLEALHSFIYGY